MAAGMSLGHPWAFAFGILGNIISFMVYLAPLPTFSRVYRMKSTEGFHSVPYVVALFSAMLWIFYALLKTNASLLITINSVGCVIESLYIIMFLIYAPKVAKILTVKLISLLNVGAFGLIVALTLLLSKGPQRAQILGWICMVFSICVFVAPLSVIRLVIRTKSVEFMPFWLSFFLTMSAVVWFAYGLVTTDIYVALPNVLGFLFGVAQMLLYIVYKSRRKTVVVEKLPEHINGAIGGKLETTTAPKAVYPIDAESVGIVVVHDMKEMELRGKEIGKQGKHDQAISTDGVEETELNSVAAV